MKINRLRNLATLSAALTICHPIDSLQSETTGVSLLVSEALAAPSSCEYQKVGSLRKVSAKGKDLNELHTLAYKKFIENLEAEIKVPSAQLQIGAFSTHVELVDGEYLFEYSVELQPSPTPEKAHHLIDMRGTVWHGPMAKDSVLKMNADKIPDWQSQMKTHYPGVHFKIASSTNGDVFHEAVLAFD